VARVSIAGASGDWGFEGWDDEQAVTVRAVNAAAASAVPTAATSLDMSLCFLARRVAGESDGGILFRRSRAGKKV
jgi:hypothetical protein